MRSTVSPLSLDLAADSSHQRLHFSHFHKSVVCSISELGPAVSKNAVPRIELSAEAIEEISMWIELTSITFFDPINQIEIRNSAFWSMQDLESVFFTFKQIDRGLSVKAVQNMALVPLLNCVVRHGDYSSFSYKIVASLWIWNAWDVVMMMHSGWVRRVDWWIE